jgi:hypothetical protein
MLQIDTGSFPGLVALVHEDFKDFKGPEKVTKASIEAKIKEVGEKVNKKWTVKSSFMGLCTVCLFPYSQASPSSYACATSHRMEPSSLNHRTKSEYCIPSSIP